jgi:hypothetical protein
VRTKDNQRQAPATVKDGATERPKKRAQDSGSVVNADAGRKRGTTASQTKTTRRLNQTVKQNADEQMAGGKKAVERWENEGGATKRAKKGRQK